MEQLTRRKSIFQEVGLDESESILPPNTPKRPTNVRFRSKDDIYVFERYHDDDTVKSRKDKPSSRSGSIDILPSGLSQSPLPEGSRSTMYRSGAALLLLVAAIPLLQTSWVFGHPAAMPIQGVDGGVIPQDAWKRSEVDLERRDDSPIDACFRWAQQSAIVNGTLYLYGGEATTQPGQTDNTWNNDFLTLDLTKTWQIGSPSLTGLPQPSGPPAVALGYLWNSYDSLYLYGGEYSWKPVESPAPFALWEYDITSSSWIEHNNPQTSSGKNAPDDAQPVQNAAEGAGITVPSLGRGFYFGGHLDGYTTPGWSQSVPREYLQSLLEYTFPGFANTQVNSLSNGQDAGSDGVFRNVTVGGLQSQFGFTQRADGLLIYVPGFGDEGILLALAGGTNETFTQMNNVNVYDIATSSWYTQATSGETPKIRVNPCAVIAAAPDGSSYNIYMFGGQNLIPYGSQTQYSDMWILTLPSFTWIQVDQSSQSVPYGRSGASCNIWDAQMVMVGGYVGASDLSCESPGIYVFDLSTLKWMQQFTALSGAGSSSSGSAAQNPLNQQVNQRAHGSDPGGLEGSYGYQVPAAVVSVIGGNGNGGATITTPVASATAGPLATGKPITYTVTSANGATATETAYPGSTTGSSSSKHNGPNIAAIVVGVVCGLLFVLVCYLLFCLYLYRKQLQLYKRHVEMSQAQARGEKPPAIPGLWATDSSTKSSSDNRRNNGGIGVINGESSSHHPSQSGSGGQTSSTAAGYQSVRRESNGSEPDDLLTGNEPTFVGVMLHPRRSLKVVNRD